MPIRVKCPVCGKSLKAGDDWAGSSANCPSCGELLKVPDGIETPSAAAENDWAALPIAAPTTPTSTTSRTLRTCKDCGGKVSKSANKCPHCGARLTTSAGNIAALGCLAILVLFGGCVVITMMAGSERDERRAAFVPDPTKQAARRDLVDKLIEQGVFQKVVMPGRVPHAWVTPLFDALSYDDKKSFCSVVYALYFPDPDDTSSGALVRLRDSRTGKDVGFYSLTVGLQLD